MRELSMKTTWSVKNMSFIFLKVESFTVTKLLAVMLIVGSGMV